MIKQNKTNHYDDTDNIEDNAGNNNKQTLDNESKFENEYKAEDDYDAIVSSLGTKNHWDQLYKRDLKVYEETGDAGEIWFGNQIEKKILHWIKGNDSSSSSAHSISKASKILDIGCGNGHFLIQLATNGFIHLVGIDYSDYSISLANNYSKSFPFHHHHPIFFGSFDFLKDTDKMLTLPFSAFDVLVDKGTLDAILLNPEVNLSESSLEPERYGGDDHDHNSLHRYPTDKKKSGSYNISSFSSFHTTIALSANTNPRLFLLIDQYKKSLFSFMKSGSLFIITSCNWTEEELINWFNHDPLEFVEQIHHSSFTFGGKKGQIVTSIIFRHK